MFFKSYKVGAILFGFGIFNYSNKSNLLILSLSSFLEKA
jgi:hypothetical protein